MALPDANNITYRTVVQRPLQYEEIDANFVELGNMIESFNTGVASLVWGSISGTLSDQTDLHNRFVLVEDEAQTNADNIDAITPVPTTTAVDKTLVNSEKCFVTTAGVTVTLPLTPTAGDVVSVGVYDFRDTVVARNGELIMGLAEDITINTEYKTITFFYVSAAIGWRIV